MIHPTSIKINLIIITLNHSQFITNNDHQQLHIFQTYENKTKINKPNPKLIWLNNMFKRKH